MILLQIQELGRTVCIHTFTGVLSIIHAQLEILIRTNCGAALSVHHALLVRIVLKLYIGVTVVSSIMQCYHRQYGWHYRCIIEYSIKYEACTLAAKMDENFGLYKYNVDIYENFTWWMGTFIMGYCVFFHINITTSFYL